MSLLIATALSCALISDDDLAARWDVDGDGAARPQDCDDLDPTVGAARVWYADLDGDGFGSAASSPVCEGPAGYVPEGGDCDDNDPLTSPNLVWFIDADGDGWGGTETTRSCTQPDGFAAFAGDCDDVDATVNPHAHESCDGRDEDCSGVADDPGEAEVCSDRLDNDCDGVVASCAVSGQARLDEAPAIVHGADLAPLMLVAGVGDLDADGKDEVVVASSRAHQGWESWSGLVTVWSGPVQGEATVEQSPVQIYGTDANEVLGTSAAGADIDGDGISDLAVGAAGLNTVFLWFGAPVSGTSGGAEIGVVASVEGFGQSLANAGDFNGDGLDDLVSGATSSAGVNGNEPCCGAVGLILGGDPADFWVDPIIMGDEEYSYFGEEVAGGADIDGDGLDDLAIGAPGGSGAAYVFLGGFTGTLHPADAAVKFTGSGGYSLGSSLALFDDTDGDGFAELLLCDVTYTKASYYLSPLSGAASTTLADAGYGFGYAVGNAGDVDGDGRDDVLVTDPYAIGGDGKSDGAAYVFFAPLAPGSLTPTDAGGTLIGPNGGDQAGQAAGGVGDLDGDGFGDFYVLQQQDTVNFQNSGEGWFLYGGPG
ncbi:hypothetical protein LBMAG42_20790 [Deltaproteobacteria bacterium]|nr:hypothetical protein LBMAG42_20790 [Deltaproteobacteria bacterium]